MRTFASVLFAFAAIVFPPGAAAADEGVVAPNANLRVEGVPPVPASLARAVEPYGELRARSIASWRPDRAALVVATRRGSTAQLFGVDGPLAPLVPITDFAEPVRWGAFLAAKPDALVFARDAGGNEQAQLYQLDPGAAEPVLLTDPKRAHRPAAFTRDRRRLLVTTVDVDRNGRQENPSTDLSLLDPLDPAASRRVATLPGTGWGGATFSFDDRRVALVQEKSVNDSVVWMLDLADGARRQVFPPAGEQRSIATDNLQFARDGAALFLVTDRDGEFGRSARYDLASGRLAYFGPADADTEELALSPDGRTLAAITNEAGFGVLRLYDADTLREIARPPLPAGTVSRAIWSHDAKALAFNLDSAQSPNDVWTVTADGTGVRRWTAQPPVAGLDPARFASPAPIAWTSFDGRTIRGFVIRPPARFRGPRPVLVDIHGGPEVQARPGYVGRANYLVDELGIAVIFPNVRGSTGFGKTFVALDNGMKREDSVRDIGALLDWIATQPDLDPKRVVVSGGSYGGYMSLAVATRYPDRIAGAVDVVGIANFVTFLERTESYRRDLRRVEYGDERDPAMREFLARISPVANAGAIRKPLLVGHGRNDPRVPYTEAEQIVEAARKNGVPTWYVLAANEGHGFAKKENADFWFYALVLFLRQTLGLP